MAEWYDASRGRIPQDWYEIHVDFRKDSHLQITIYGCKDAKKTFLIDFGIVSFFEVIDEGWSLNGGDFTDNFEDKMNLGMTNLVEIVNGEFGASIQSVISIEDRGQLHHFVLLGLNYIVEIVGSSYPIITEL